MLRPPETWLRFGREGSEQALVHFSRAEAEALRDHLIKLYPPSAQPTHPAAIAALAVEKAREKGQQ
jgi:hypothetical protein